MIVVGRTCDVLSNRCSLKLRNCEGGEGRKIFTTGRTLSYSSNLHMLSICQNRFSALDLLSNSVFLIPSEKKYSSQDCRSGDVSVRDITTCTRVPMLLSECVWTWNSKTPVDDICELILDSRRAICNSCTERLFGDLCCITNEENCTTWSFQL